MYIIYIYEYKFIYICAYTIHVYMSICIYVDIYIQECIHSHE